MIIKKSKAGLSKEMRAIENDAKNLVEMFEYFLMERQLGKPIEALGEAVADMRRLIGRILVDYFMGLDSKEEEKFCKTLALMLAETAESISLEPEGDGKYIDYCIGEILTSFEIAQEIKKSNPHDPVRQKMLALDIPVLRPFDYGLRGKLKIIETGKKKIKRVG